MVYNIKFCNFQINYILFLLKACDPAGPGFDPVYRLDPKRAANFIQCIHTSNTYGTKVYNCHQDWRMGVCGHKQIGAGPFPYGSHGLCNQQIYF